MRAISWSDLIIRSFSITPPDRLERGCQRQRLLEPQIHVVGDAGGFKADALEFLAADALGGGLIERTFGVDFYRAGAFLGCLDGVARVGEQSLRRRG